MYGFGESHSPSRCLDKLEADTDMSHNLLHEISFKGRLHGSICYLSFTLALDVGTHEALQKLVRICINRNIHARSAHADITL